jgi:glutamate carboxypeptidase
MQIRFTCFLLPAILLTWVQAAAQVPPLSPEEKKLVSYIRSHMPSSLQLLEELVNINSGTRNITGVKKVGAQLAARFDSIGFVTEWVNLPDSLQRAGHLVVSKKGTKGKKIFLIGHLDTVFEPDTPPNPFHYLSDSIASGQGVNDMKGGDVIIFAALQALSAQGLLKDRQIVAYFTGDEEQAGHPIAVSRADYITRARQADLALAFESAQGLSTIATARRGSSTWELKVTGQRAHSSGIFTNNYGSVYEAARILEQFRLQLSKEKYLTFNPGLIAGGADMDYDSSHISAKLSGKNNIIAPFTVVQGDLRFLTSVQEKNARERMRSIATQNNLPGTSAQFNWSEGIPAMEPTAGNLQLARQLDAVSQSLGFGPVKPGDPGSRGAGDISYIASYLSCLDGLGASGKGAHAPGETINMKEFPMLIERAAIFIYRLTR